MTKSERRQRWKAMCEAYLRGSESQREFCRGRGLSVSSVQYWLQSSARRRGGKPKQPNSLRLPQPPPSESFSRRIAGKPAPLRVQTPDEMRACQLLTCLLRI